ncbi:MAG: hypothetical protein GF401_04120 [Chitinivibrionales bacterium]|nr:hypothetical protein [Chitinivibrionales bacterium]
MPACKTEDHKASCTGVLRLHSWRPDSAGLDDNVWYDDYHGFLYIDFRRSQRTCIRISTWERGLQVSQWHPVLEIWECDDWDPGITLPFDTSNRHFKAALDEYAETFPPGVVENVKHFAWRQIMLLKMIRQCPQTMDLLESNPVLAWLLADEIAGQKIPVDEGARWALCKRRAILRLIGINATESYVRILARIKCRQYYRDLCYKIRELVSLLDHMSSIRKLKEIPADEICNLIHNFEFTNWLLSPVDESGKLVRHTVDRDKRASLSRLWSDMRDCARDLEISNYEQKMFSCHSAAELRTLYNKWIDSEKFDRLFVKQSAKSLKKIYGTNKLPSPPLAGTSTIMPVETIEELIDESITMHNCLHACSRMIMERSCYIYRVLEPQRATLAVAYEGNKIVPLELRTVANGEADEETWKSVQEWIAGTEK